MFNFFKKKEVKQPEENTSDFLDNEKSIFDTQAAVEKPISEVPDYDSLIYQPPVYNAPKYKAQNMQNIGVIVDNNEVGFDPNAFNTNVNTTPISNDENSGGIVVNDFSKNSNDNINNVNINTTNNNTEVLDIFDTVEPIQDTSLPIPDSSINDKTSNMSIFEQPVSMPPKENINHNNISIPNNNSTEANNNDEDSTVGISIFGSNDGTVTNVNTYSSNNQFEEAKKELTEEVEYTKDGYKICPNCGAILNPSAPVCFMCSKSFVLKK